MEENQQNQFSEQRTFTIKDVTSMRRVFELKKRIRAVAGGTSASKTVSILVWLIDYAQSYSAGGQLITVVSESFPHLSGGAMMDFETIMKDRGYWDDKCWVKSPVPTYTFKLKNGVTNKMEFKSIDTYGKAHGPRRDILFINECNNLAYNIADQLITRTRKVVFLDWNPSTEFWFYSEMLPHRDDIDFITLTYKDNEALDQVTIKEIESHMHNKSWWQVYGLGQLGELEEKIYRNWNFIDDVPHEAKLRKRGLDFGYTNDPTAIVDIYEYNGGRIYDQQLYMKGLSNKQIADYLLSLPEPKTLVIADSAEPKSIAEIRSYGVNIVAAEKGKDSIVHGIQFVQDLKVSVTKRSVELIKEYRNYVWMTDKEGRIINVPIDIWNHAMDAIRYAESSGRKPVMNYQPTDVGGINPLIPGIG